MKPTQKMGPIPKMKAVVAIRSGEMPIADCETRLTRISVAITYGTIRMRGLFITHLDL